MSEINPNHPVTQEVRDQWHKICAILLNSIGIVEFEITQQMIEKLVASGMTSVVADTRGGKFIIRLVGDETAMKLAKHAGGLPV
jgi:hypothetical protein